MVCDPGVTGARVAGVSPGAPGPGGADAAASSSGTKFTVRPRGAPPRGASTFAVTAPSRDAFRNVAARAGPTLILIRGLENTRGDVAVDAPAAALVVAPLRERLRELLDLPGTPEARGQGPSERLAPSFMRSAGSGAWPPPAPSRARPRPPRRCRQTARTRPPAFLPALGPARRTEASRAPRGDAGYDAPTCSATTREGTSFAGAQRRRPQRARGSARARRRREPSAANVRRGAMSPKHPDQRARGCRFASSIAFWCGRRDDHGNPRPNLRHLRLGGSGRSSRRKPSVARAPPGGSFPARADQLVALQQALGGGLGGSGSVDVCSVSPRSPSLSSSLDAVRAEDVVVVVVLGVLVRPDAAYAPRANRRALRAAPSCGSAALAARSRHIILNCSNSSSGATVGAPGASPRRSRGAHGCPSRSGCSTRARASAPSPRRRRAPRAPCAPRSLWRRTRASRKGTRARGCATPGLAQPSATRRVSASCDRRSPSLFVRGGRGVRDRRVRQERRALGVREAHGPSPAPGAPLPRGAWRGGDGDRSRDSASLPSKSVLSTTLCVSLLPGRTEIFAALRPASAVFASARCSDVCRARRAWGGGVTDRRVARVRRGTARRNAKTRSRGRGGGLLLCENSKNPYHASGAFAPRATRGRRMGMTGATRGDFQRRARDVP